METAKVDIRKLQVLNDRINQALDALNQVRLSVHGLSHTSPSPTIPFGGYPFAPAGLAPIGGLPYASYQPGVPYQPGVSFPPGVIPGLSHTAPLAVPGLMPGAWTQAIPWVNPLTGLSHTSPEVVEAYNRNPLADPFMTMRIGQTFPFAQSAFPPVLSLY